MRRSEWRRDTNDFRGSPTWKLAPALSTVDNDHDRSTVSYRNGNTDGNFHNTDGN